MNPTTRQNSSHSLSSPQPPTPPPSLQQSELQPLPTPMSSPSQTSPAPTSPPTSPSSSQTQESLNQLFTDVYGLVKPRCRGLVHAWSIAPFALAGLILLVLTPSLSARVAIAVYVAAICAMLTTSALYHRLHVSRAAQQWLRKADHSMIGVAVAGTYTPVIAMTLHGSRAVAMLVLLWGGALGAALLALFWPSAPRALVAAVYIALGWAGIAVVPQLVERSGTLPLVLIVIGGVLYMFGAIVYAKRRPVIRPTVFGFHELFHTFVVAAAIAQFSAIAVLVARLPH